MCTRLTPSSNGSTTYASSETVNFATTNIGNGWVRIEVTYTPTSTTTYRVAATGNDSYVDCLQLEQEDAASSFNLVEDGSFESGIGSWTLTGTADSATYNTFFGTKVAHVSASAGKHHLEQNVALSLPSETTFFFSGWAKANADPNSVAAKASDNDVYFGLYARIYYQGVSTPETQFFPFDAYYGEWQYTETALIPKQANKTITQITVACAYDSNINDVYFDNIALRIEPAQTYRYDDKGNPVAATQSGAGSESAIYSGVDLTQYTAENGTKTMYTYNAAHDVLTASLGGVTCTNTYDTSGNITQAKLTGSGTSYFLQSSSILTTDRNHISSSTDANGNMVSYTYSPNTEQLASTTQNGVTVYNVYNADGTPNMIYQNGVAALTYSYAGGQLTQIDRKSYRNSAEQHQLLNMAYNAWGQQTSIKVGTQTLTTNTYAANGGNLTKTTFSNGQYVDYTYDEFDRLTQVKYNNTGRYICYYYNAEGALSKLTYGDGSTAKGSYQFEYDSLGRLIRSAEYNGGGTLVQRTEHNYDAYNRLRSQKWVLGNKNYSESYSYSDGTSGDGSLTKMTTGTGFTLNYTYDALKRLQKTEVKDGSTVKFSTAYAYRTISGNQSSAQVQYRNVRVGTSGTLLEGAKYSYDAHGNISMISQSIGSYYPLVAYEYDSQNQLTKETYYDGTGTGSSHVTDTYVYTYDTAGNILTVKKNGTTTQTYTYSTGNWKDQLTAVNGNSIVYDNSGNPTTYRRGTSTAYDLTWTNGKQLSFVGCYDEQWQVSYSYDADGIRTEKNDDGVLHEYVTQNGKVVRETIGSGSTAKILDFIYDESGRPFALNYSTNNGTSFTAYYYILNQQGDVVKLVNASGTASATYSYDAWGNIRSSSGTLAAVNPLRYRGYYYDIETGFYYLQSRYYDPANHRFINADSYASTNPMDAIACNMFAYCNNNPVMGADPTGKSVIGIIGIIIAVVGVAVALSGCSSQECNAVVLSNEASGWMKTSGTMADDLADAIGSPNHRVQAITDSNFSEVWDGITENYISIHTHGSPNSLGGDNLLQDVVQLSLLNRNNNIKCVVITACSTGNSNGSDPNVGQVLSTKISQDGFVICCTESVMSSGSTFYSKTGGPWVIYQNGSFVRNAGLTTFTMEDFIAELMN